MHYLITGSWGTCAADRTGAGEVFLRMIFAGILACSMTTIDWRAVAMGTRPPFAGVGGSAVLGATQSGSTSALDGGWTWATRNLAEHEIISQSRQDYLRNKVKMYIIWSQIKTANLNRNDLQSRFADSKNSNMKQRLLSRLPEDLWPSAWLHWTLHSPDGPIS